MNKHSPGPWVWQGIGRDGAPTLYACGGEKRYLVKGASGATTPRLSDADARLMAAAPEMLELLRRYLGSPDVHGVPDLDAETRALIDRINSK